MSGANNSTAPNAKDAGPSSAGPPSTPRQYQSHNRVWVNPNFNHPRQTKDSQMTDEELREAMGLGPNGTSEEQNEYGKRPRKQGPTPTQKPAGKRRKNKNKNNSNTRTPAQERLHASMNASAAETDGAAGSASAGQSGGTTDAEEGRNRKRAKDPSLARLMGGSKTVVAQLEKEECESQPQWKTDIAVKRKQRLFPDKPEGVSQELLELAESSDVTPTEAKICKIAAQAIDKAVTALHNQADQRTEGLLDEVVLLQRRFEDAAADTARQSRKCCMEFWSAHLRTEEGSYSSNTDLLRRLNLTLFDKHGVKIPMDQVSDVHPLRKRKEGTIIVKFLDRKEGSIYHLLSSPWLLPKNDSAVKMEMTVSVSPYDGNIRDALLWWKFRCTFMRATAALKGIEPDSVVPKKKWVIGVKVSPTPGIMQAKFPTEGPAKKKYRYEVIATYTQLKTLMGQHALDRYLLGGDSNRWDAPKKIDREVARKEKGKGNQPTSENQMADDSLPESVQQMEVAEQPDAGGERGEEAEQDAVEKAVKEMDNALSLEEKKRMEEDD